MTSCITQQATVTTIANYITFEENGVYATESNTIPYEYRPVGSVISVTTSSNIEGLNMGAAFKEIADKVILNGGNGIINLDVKITSSKDSHYMTLTGMAVSISDEGISNYLKRRMELNPIKEKTNKETPKKDSKSNQFLQRYLKN